MQSTKLGIIGLGRHGSRYARHAAQDVEALRLTAICRRDEAAGLALAGNLGCRWTGDAGELIASDDVDAVVLVTVPSLLPELVTLAAKLGKPLLVEKPVAAGLEIGRAMLAAVESANIYCIAGHTLRFNSLCLAMRDEIGRLGRIDTLTFSQRFPPQLQLDWLDDPARSGGGNIMHTGVHCFDLLRWFTGLEVSSVACSTRSAVTTDTEDNFVASLQLSNGSTLAQVNCSRSSNSRNGLIEISGEHGQLVGDHVLGTLHFLGPDGPRELTPGAPVMTVPAILESFAAGVGGKRGATAASYRDGLAAVAVAEACYRSVSSGRFEDVAAV
ncbi:MAG: Gfo/Idh/MocA family oxidoreductase [Proteobacteria bacterium]|nr:Gfo/Idh/MocA family oxidoreductase [Pseudomonadota bacterium]